MTLIAADVGTTNSVMSVLDRQGNPKLIPTQTGDFILPSVVYFEENGEILVGKEAKNARDADPSRGVSEFKRSMGTEDTVLSLDNKEYKATDILIIILKEMKKCFERHLSRTVNEITLTVPANYSDKAKNQTLEAAKKAGFEKVIILAKEPTAAAFGNGIHKRKNSICLILDIGGGTFDASLIKVANNTSEVIATDGISKLGGLDFTLKLEELILEEFFKEHKFIPKRDKHPIFYQDLRNKSEQLKIALTQRESAPLLICCGEKVLRTVINRSSFEKCIEPLIDQTLEVASKIVTESGINPKDIEFIPCGGASLTPLVRKKIEVTFNKKSLSLCDPLYAVCLGACHVGVFTKQMEGKEVELEGGGRLPRIYSYQERMSHSVGVACLDEDTNELKSWTILEKGKRIPGLFEADFFCAEPNQTDVEIIILQGEHNQPIDNCLELGRMMMRDIPPQEIHKLVVSLNISKHDLIKAECFDPISQKRADMEITYTNSTKEES